MSNNNTVQIENYKIVDKGVLYSSFDVHIPSWQLTIKDCKEMKSQKGSHWIAFPSETYQDREGKTKYKSLLYMPKEIKDKFDKSVISELERLEPSAPSHFEKNDDPLGDAPF